jgi:hypothetical protein
VKFTFSRIRGAHAREHRSWRERQRDTERERERQRERERERKKKKYINKIIESNIYKYIEEIIKLNQKN